jgi:Phage integrase family
MVLLAVLSGLRRGEIFGLRWRSIDWLEGSIAVVEANYEGHSAAPRTRASCRKAFVDATVIESLRQLRPDKFQPEDFVFHTDRGTPLNPNNVLNRVLHSACKEAGIPRASWHNFRYTFSTWANPTGESIKALQSQLGHTDSRLTLSVIHNRCLRPKSFWRAKSLGFCSQLLPNWRIRIRGRECYSIERKRERVARPRGVEPPTFWFVARRSIQLSYGRVVRFVLFSHNLGGIARRYLNNLVAHGGPIKA